MAIQSIQDLIRQEKKKIESEASSSIRPIRPEMGKHTYRILPSWRDGSAVFFHRFGQHFIKDAKGKILAVYVCADATFGEACEVCAAIGEGIRNATDDETISLLKEANSKKRYYVNVLHRTSPVEAERNVPKLMDLPLSVFGDIASIVEDYGDITSLTEGVDIIIERTGTGLGTEYRVMPAPKSAPVPASVLASLTDIDAVVTQANETRQANALGAIAKVRGIDSARLISPPRAEPTRNPPRAEPVATKEVLAEVAEEADYFDVDEDLPDLSDTDDLDSMIADLEKLGS